MEEKLYIALTHFSAMALLLGGLLLWLRRREGQRSRTILSVVCFITAALYFTRIAMCYAGEKQGLDGILPETSLLAGMIAITLYLTYPLEVIRPGIIGIKNLLRLFSGYIVMAAIVYAMKGYGVEFIRLESFSELLAHITEPNVWIRLVILLVVVCYSLILLYVPHKGKVKNTDNHWIIIVAFGGQLISILYAMFVITDSDWWRIIHLGYFTLFYLWIVYQELFIRLFIVSPEPDNSIEETVAVAAEPMPNGNGDFWESLCRYMDEEEPWRNPDLTIVSLAEYLHTNRTKLSTEIHTHGYTHLSDFISAYRIGVLCDRLDRGEVGSMDDAFFEVGYRSRSTAFDSFKKHTGCTPRQYFKMNPEEKKSIKQKMK